MSLGKLVVSLTLDAAGYEQGSKEAAEAGKRLEKRLQSAMENISKYGTLAAGAIAAGLSAAFTTAVNRMDAFDELSERIGVSVDQLQRLAYAGQMTGVTQEDLASALQRVTVNAGKALQGNKELVQAFAALRINVAELQGLTPEQLFQRLAEAVASSNDSSERSAVLSEILGKNYSTLVPLLSQGAEGMKAFGDEAERFGLVTGPEAAKQAALFNDNLDRLKANALGLSQDLAGKVLPQLNDFVDRLFKGRQIFGSLYEASQQLGASGYRSDFGAAIKETNADLEIARQKLEQIESFQSRTGRVSPALEGAQKRVDGLLKQLEFFKALQREEVLANKDLQSPDERRFASPKFSVPPVGGSGSKGGGGGESAYEKFLKKITQLNADVLASTENLSRTEQVAARIRAEFLDTSVRMSDAERSRLNAILNNTVALDGYNTAQQRAKDALAAFRDAQFKSEQAAIGQRDRQAEVVAQLERDLEQVGLNADQLARLTDARQAENIALEKQKLAALKLNQAATQPEIEALREKIRLMERERQVRNELFNKEGAAKQRAEEEKQSKDREQRVRAGLEEAVFLGLTGRGKEAGQTLRKLIATELSKEAFNILLGVKGQGGAELDLQSLFKDIWKFFETGPGKGALSWLSSLLPFEKGGVFTSPQVFGFNNGGKPRMGIMAEAGPEAVMPLRRGPDGSLGVVATGGSPAITYAPVVNIYGDGVTRAEVAQALEETRRITIAQLGDMVNRRDSRVPF